MMPRFWQYPVAKYLWRNERDPSHLVVDAKGFGPQHLLAVVMSCIGQPRGEGFKLRIRILMIRNHKHLKHLLPINCPQ